MPPRGTTVGDIIATDEPGFACSKSKLVESGLIHLRPFNVSLEGVLSLHELYQVPSGDAPVGRAKLEPGDILFNNTNSAELVGKSSLVTAPMVAGFSNHLNRIRVDPSKVDPKWFALWLRRKRETGFFSQHATRWVSQAAYKTSELKKLPIELPALSEQRRVADLLSRAENIVRMRREAEQKAKEIIPALFLDMFGDPATNPKGWEVAELRDHIELLTGYPFKSQEFVPEGETVRLCRGANVLPQQVDWSDARHWPARRSEEFAEYTLRRGDIVLAMDRPWISTGLKVARIAESDLPALLVQRVARIRPKPTVAASYVYVSLCHSSFAAHCNAVKTETVVPHISPNDIRSYRMPIPPIFVQARFASVVDGVEGLATQAGQALEMAVDAFQSLLVGVFEERRDP